MYGSLALSKSKWNLEKKWSFDISQPSLLVVIKSLRLSFPECTLAILNQDAEPLGGFS